MAKGTFELQLTCAAERCGCGVSVTVTVPVAKDSPRVLIEDAVQAAAVKLGMRRVHAAGARAQVFCGEHAGPIECRRCRFQIKDGKCPCMGGPAFDVDRYIAEDVDADV